MTLSCPHVFPDDTRCHGEVEYELEEVSNGDGVWAESGWAVVIEPDADGKVYCSEGHVLSKAQIEKLEQDALTPSET